MAGDEQKNKHPLHKLLTAGEKPFLKIGCEPLKERQEFLYVFGQEQRVSIKGYTVKVLAFAGVAPSCTVSVLPMFLYAETSENAPWTDILNDLSKYCGYENLIVAEYGSAVAGALQALQLTAKHFSIVSYVPENAVKHVLEKVFREFETAFKKFWWKCGAIQVSEFSEIEAIAETSIKELTERFDGKSFILAAEAEIPVLPFPDAIMTKETSAVSSGAAGPVPVTEAAAYCIAFEKSCFDAGGRRRFAVFFAVYKGTVKKAVITVLPDQVDDAAWEKAIKRASDAIGRIDYLLFCGCPVNMWTINKGILPKAKWCVSIADFDSNERYCEMTKQKRNELDYEVMSKFNGNASEIKAYLSQAGISDVAEIG